MSPFETTPHISNEAFALDAQAQLDVAWDETASPQQITEAANLVLSKLADVENKDLIVEPPLTDKQKEDFSKLANTIIKVVERTEEGLKNAGKGRKAKAAAAAVAGSTAKAFTGAGGAAKS